MLKLVVDDPPEQSLPLSWCRRVGGRRRGAVEIFVVLVTDSCGSVVGVEGVMAVVAVCAGCVQSAVVFGI